MINNAINTILHQVNRPFNRPYVASAVALTITYAALRALAIAGMSPFGLAAIACITLATYRITQLDSYEKLIAILDSYLETKAYQMAGISKSTSSIILITLAHRETGENITKVVLLIIKDQGKLIPKPGTTCPGATEEELVAVRATYGPIIGDWKNHDISQFTVNDFDIVWNRLPYTNLV